MEIDNNLNDQTKNQHDQFTFDTIKANFSTLKLPNKNWHPFASLHMKLISFYTVQDDGITRRVDILPDLSVQVVIDLILISENYMPRLTCLDDVVEFLETVTRWNLCDTLKNSKGCIPLVSCEGVLPWISRLQNICPSCASGAKTIDSNSETDTDFEQSQEEKRIEESKIRKTMAQRMRRQKMKIQKLEEQVSALRKSCADVDEEMFEEIIDSYDDAVQTEFRTCFSAAKKCGEVENEMQYDIDWINHCLLIRTNHENIYDYLRTKRLPLPSKQMLTRFVNLLV